ncbi:MAG: MBL fold metallo-hydrolase [Halobacteriota archaeon]|nr:MBL fold metallo-hydrolase [Halobacteriota archaeon]
MDDLLLDYGMKPSDPPQFPLNGIRPRSIIVSHAHLDHSGIVPNLMDLKLDVFMTPPTRDISYLMGKDTIKIGKEQGILPFIEEDLKKFMEKTTLVSYNEDFFTSGYSVRLHDAGHIPGSSCIYLEGKKSLLYTGDINTMDTRLINGADPNYPAADILIIESTYYNKSHPNRAELEKAFIESITETLDNGGNAIIPCFAVGRTQEIVMILHAHGFSPYVDGMGIEVFEIIEKSPSFLKDEKELTEAFDNVRFVKRRRRSGVLSEPSIVVTTAGMLNGGPVLYYISKIHNDPMSKILLTGYQVEDTNGRKAIEQHRIEVDGRILNIIAKVEQYDFSAHADDAGLKSIVSKFCDSGVECVFTVHGDDTKGFAEWIRENCECDAIAPENGDEVSL